MNRPSCLLLALLALSVTPSLSNAFTWPAATLQQRAEPTSSSSLAVLRDLRSTRTQTDNDDEDDDEILLMRNNGIRQALSFTELLQNSHHTRNGSSTKTTTSASSKKKHHPHSRFVAETLLPTDLGMFRMRGYTMDPVDPVLEPCVIYAADKPPFGQASAVPVRIHDQCLTSEVFGSLRCDCSEQLRMAMKYIQENGGFIIYLQQEGRGIGLANKIAAYALQDVGFDTVDANVHLGFAEDCREYYAVPSILRDMQVGSIQLITNNPRKVDLLTKLGVTVESTIPTVVDDTTEHNYQYMETKERRMHHANLAALLTRGTTAQAPVRNGMAPLNMPTNGQQQTQQPLLGVHAAEDGYCFGRQSVEDAIAAMGRGELVVVVDDMDRENEGDFIMAADLCTPSSMAQIVRYSSGVVCIALEEERLKELELPPMVTNNQDPKGTAFTVTVDATKEHGITTGISASDRSTTVRLLADPKSQPTDFHRPGHIFPLRAREGGVLTRDGHTEAAVDLARLAGRSAAGVLCEIVSEDDPTEMMRLPEIRRFCQKHGYVLTSIADLQQYRRDTGL